MKIVTAQKSDKKSIKRFYKSNRYSAGFMGDDLCFFITEKMPSAPENTPLNPNLNRVIIACVIVSYQYDTPFLHALVVSEKFRNKGLASKLIRHCTALLQNVYCFSTPKHLTLYEQHGFDLINEEQLPLLLKSKYIAYKKHKENLSILAFIH